MIEGRDIKLLLKDENYFKNVPKFSHYTGEVKLVSKKSSKYTRKTT